MTSGIAVNWHDYAMIARRGWSLLPDTKHRAKLPESPTDIILLGQSGLLING
jgi:hypothetical protein